MGEWWKSQQRVVGLAALIAAAIICGIVLAFVELKPGLQSSRSSGPDQTTEGPKAPASAPLPLPDFAGDPLLTRMQGPTSVPPIVKRDVRNHNRRPGGIQPYAIVMHTTGSGRPGSEIASLRDLRRAFNGRREVSAHYAIDQQGRIMQYVPDGRRGWHTAASGWNDISIGIEIVNDSSGRQPFPRKQVAATRALVQYLGTRYDIPVQYVVRHRDVQPWDRSDPPNNFSWAAFRRSLATRR